MSKEFTSEVKAAIYKPTGVCISYIGYQYSHDERTGKGVCIDMYDNRGKIAKCADLIRTRMCPYGRTSPYDELNKNVT
jgi:hypothetical protein